MVAAGFEGEHQRGAGGARPRLLDGQNFGVGLPSGFVDGGRNQRPVWGNDSGAHPWIRVGMCCRCRCDDVVHHRVYTAPVDQVVRLGA